MKKGFLIMISFLICFTRSGAADGEYAVSKIPQTLLKNADAVLRFEEMRFEIVQLREAIQTYRYVITILNENADHWAAFSEYYDKLRDITSVQGNLYDASGNLVRKLKSKELEDVSGVSEIS